jgi:AraC-like DNA-binding protein
VRYRERPPLPELADFIERIWTLEGHAAPGDGPQPVMPDGRPELVLHFGTPFRLVSAAGHEARQSSILFVGQLRSRLLLRPDGPIGIVGIRFHPHGAAAVLRMPQHELAGAPIGLDTLHPELRRALAAIEPGAGALDAAARDAQRVLTAWLNRERIDRRVSHAVSLLARTRGRLPIDRVATSSGLTRRHLERRFLDHVGLTPKRFARIMRFQHALRLLDQPDAASGGAHAAAECGFADQAHFTRDFRELAGCPPSQHLLRKAEITGFFIAASG